MEGETRERNVMDRPRTWGTWEAHFRPYPDLIAEMGFDNIADKIRDALTEDDCKLVADWGSVDLSGYMDRVITLIVEEERAEANPDPAISPADVEDFQYDVGNFLASLGLGGFVIAQRLVNLAQDGDDE